jgi:hypothetical protein
MVKVTKAMQLNTKDVEPMLNPLKRDLGRDSKKGWLGCQCSIVLRMRRTVSFQ